MGWLGGELWKEKGFARDVEGAAKSLGSDYGVGVMVLIGAS